MGNHKKIQRFESCCPDGLKQPVDLGKAQVDGLLRVVTMVRHSVTRPKSGETRQRRSAWRRCTVEDLVEGSGNDRSGVNQVEVTVGENRLSLTNATAEQQERLVEHFIKAIDVKR